MECAGDTGNGGGRTNIGPDALSRTMQSGKGIRLGQNHDLLLVRDVTSNIALYSLSARVKLLPAYVRCAHPEDHIGHHALHFVTVHLDIMQF